MKRFLLLLILGAFAVQVNAQLYSVSTPFKPINKTTSHGILHEFIQIDNLSGQPLPMRWIGHIGGVLECPPGWDFAVTDPDSAYAVLNDNDSADFILSDTNFTDNKIIISVIHNGFIGNCQVTFDIFPLSNPADVTTIGFNITVTQGSVAVGEYTVTKKNIIYPNPSNGLFYVKEDELQEINVFNASGEKLFTTEQKQVDLSNYPTGFYFVQLTKTSGEWSYHKLLKD